VLEYLKLDVSDQKQEQMFLKYDKDGSGEIDYAEFRQIWLAVADVRKELGDRGVDIPKFATRRQLQRMLEKCLDEEEEAERRAMAEAERWRSWRAILEQKNEYLKHARRRAHDRYGRGDAVLPCIICTGGQKCETCVMKDRFGQGRKRVRNSQLQRFLSRPFSTRFG